MNLLDLLRRRPRETRPAPPADGPPPATPLPGDPARREALRQDIIRALRGVYDPEIPVNIYDLGLIYDLAIDDAGRVDIRMTLTAPGCPVAQTFPDQVAAAVEAVEGVSRASVELTWDPPWDIRRASEAARLQMGFFP